MPVVLPDDPFSLVPASAPLVAALRAEQVCGATCEVVLLPGRRGRRGIPAADRPALQPDPVPRIVAAEAVWQAPGLALTGNRFPFAARHLVLWATGPHREPTPALLAAAFAIEDRHGGSSIVNSLGAAASIPRSHVHLIGERSRFLAELPRREVSPGDVHLPLAAGCRVWRLGLPILAVGLQGSPADRATAVRDLLACCTTPSFNLVGSDGICWLFPRSSTEIPAPHFPQALGGAELWGRWCCDDEAVFHRLSRQDMEAALRAGGVHG